MGESHLSTWDLKIKKNSLTGVRDGAEDRWKKNLCVRRIWHTLAGFEMQGQFLIPQRHHWELRGSTSGQPAGKLGLRLTITKCWIRPITWICLEVHYYWAPRKSPAASHLDLGLVKPGTRKASKPSWTTDIQDCETVLTCYFEFSLWYFLSWH